MHNHNPSHPPTQHYQDGSPVKPGDYVQITRAVRGYVVSIDSDAIFIREHKSAAAGRSGAYRISVISEFLLPANVTIEKVEPPVSVPLPPPAGAVVLDDNDLAWQYNGVQLRSIDPYHTPLLWSDFVKNYPNYRVIYPAPREREETQK